MRIFCMHSLPHFILKIWYVYEMSPLSLYLLVFSLSCWVIECSSSSRSNAFSWPPSLIYLIKKDCFYHPNKFLSHRLNSRNVSSLLIVVNGSWTNQWLDLFTTITRLQKVNPLNTGVCYEHVHTSFHGV